MAVLSFCTNSVSRYVRLPNTAYTRLVKRFAARFQALCVAKVGSDKVALPRPAHQQVKPAFRYLR
jgi:hypothetical protein